MKVILKGSPNTQWNIGNQFLDGGSIVDITPEEAKKHSDVIATFIDLPTEEKKVEEKKEIPEPKLISEAEIFELNAAEQKEMIKKFGEKPASTEVERVKQILKLQVK